MEGEGRSCSTIVGNICCKFLVSNLCSYHRVAKYFGCCLQNSFFNLAQNLYGQ
ncbi:hypothetical protein LguiA_019374 [Lonicera macranthoides]